MTRLKMRGKRLCVWNNTMFWASQVGNMLLVQVRSYESNPTTEFRYEEPEQKREDERRGKRGSGSMLVILGLYPPSRDQPEARRYTIPKQGATAAELETRKQSQRSMKKGAYNHFLLFFPSLINSNPLGSTSRWYILVPLYSGLNPNSISNSARSFFSCSSI